MGPGEIYSKWTSVSLVVRIVVGLVIGAVLALLVPGITILSTLGSLFVGALKAIAPFLVLLLVMSAIGCSGAGLGSRFKNVLVLYIGSTVVAAVVATFIFYSFPVSVVLPGDIPDAQPPLDMGMFANELLLNIVSNPLTALAEGKYLSILFWAIIFGLVMKATGTPKVKELSMDISDLVTRVVRVIIEFAPIGIMGIVYETVSENGVGVFTDYGALILVLLVCMAMVMFLTNPVIGGLLMRRNPYPLLFLCLRQSGIYAFFTRSSAANIPMNIALCERIGLDKNFYSVSIPLGATINMNGAAITITVLTLCTAYTIGMDVPMITAMVLCILATLAACGASGISGGSLLLVPMACSFMGIPEETAMMMVSVGFVIGVINDSVETALNSSADVFYTTVSEVMEDRRNGKESAYHF